MADSADRRAWDAVIEGSDWEACLDAETRVGDLQAVQRRVALKQRDGGARNAILLHADTRHHRELLRLTGDGFQTQFPITARRSLAALGAGRWPGGNSLILL